MRKKLLSSLVVIALTAQLTGCNGNTSVEQPNEGSSVVIDVSEPQNSTTPSSSLSESSDSADIEQETEINRSEKERDIKANIDSGSYSYAYGALKEYISLYGEDETAVSINADIKQRVLGDVNKQADEYIASDDILGAREFVGSQIAVFSDYTELSDLYTELTDSYVDNIIDKAKETASWGDFSGAYEIIKAGMNNIGDNDRLINFKNRLSDCEPVYLVDIEPFSISSASPSVYINQTLFESKIRYTVESFSDTAKDNTGTEHLFAYFIGRNQKTAQGECSATYLLNGQYDTFSGTGGFPYYRSIAPNPAYFNIYGDDELLYSSPYFDSDVMPEDFLIDISGVDLLKIEFHNDGSVFSNNEGAKIYDAMLTKSLNFD